MKKRMISFLLCLCLLAAVPSLATEPAPEYTYGGWNESLWMEIPNAQASEVQSVRYTGPVSGSLEGQDFRYLIRDTAKGLRIDIPGLPAGTYEVTVKTGYWDFVCTVQVQSYDRSGYAHFGYKEGVGAYNDDGTLKENAIVLYVTEENKDAVTLTSRDGTTVTGIGNILNSRGRASNGGSKTNTNQDILRKLAADGTPLVVRIIGRVTLPEGLTAYNSTDYGGSVGDNGAMARMQGGKDITIEGIGADAFIDGWGLHFICGGGDYVRGWGKSFEVRNITFRNVPEDCVGMEGEQDGSNLNAPVERCWIHHCAFYGPKIANPAESDKDGGDGACDFKRGQYFTNAYCYYEGYHKTNLVGGSDSNLQYHITYHHNYWKNCESRGPLARQANIHMYNNIFEGQSSYCMNPRANAYIFSEYNLFLNSKNPVRVTMGAVKSFGDLFENCRGDNHATIVTEKTTPVDTACKYANFDTDPALSYIPQGDYLLHDSISSMREAVLSQAGPQGMGNAGEGGDVGGGEDEENNIAPGSYVHNFTENGKESEFFSISGNLSSSKGTVTFENLTLTQCLKMETATSITFTAPESGTLVLVFGGTVDAAGKTVKIDGVRQTIGEENVLTVTVLPGSHTITKGDIVNLFLMAYTSASAQEHTHSYESVVTEPTCTDPGSTVYTCDCGHSYTVVASALGHDLTDWITVPGGSRQGRHCLRCDFEEYEDLPPCPHEDVQWDEGVAPTCTQPGREPSGFCQDCGRYVKVGETIPATDHQIVVTENAPTCTRPGEWIAACTRCDWMEKKVFPVVDHSYGPDYLCQVCGAEDPARPVDPATEPTQPATTLPQTDSKPNPAPKQDGFLWVAVLAGVAFGVTAGVITNRKKKS